MTLHSDVQAASFRSHSPAQLWSHRMPSPPRIVIPPPAIATNGIPDLQVVQGTTPNFEASGFANTTFLETVTYNNFLKTNVMLDWKYEDRRMAQQVLPFLYLGPSAAARDGLFLRNEGITMVLAVRNTLSAQAKLLGSKPGEALGLEVKGIDVMGNQELIAAFPRGIEAINTHLSQVYMLSQQGRAPMIGGAPRTSGKVLVFCESGNERSASLVAAYMMAMYSKNLVAAIQIVQAQRFSVALDDSMRNLLSSYEDILKARRDVVQAQNTKPETRRSLINPTHLSGNANGKSKRSYDDAMDDTMDEDDGIDLDMKVGLYEESMSRGGMAPFQD